MEKAIAARAGTSIEWLEISVRAANALQRSPYRTVGDLALLGPIDLLQIPGVGRMTAHEIVSAVRHFIDVGSWTDRYWRAEHISTLPQEKTNG